MVYFLSNQWFDDHEHPRLSQYYKGGPWDLCAIVAVYLSVVLVIGPRYMKGREPFSLVKAMKIYNVINVVANIYLVVTWLYYTRALFDCWHCKDAQMPDFIHLVNSFVYLYLKIFDLMDTVFFVLRKKERQITVLHLIHHSVMPFTVYGAIKFAPTSTTYMTATLNSIVHMCMYSYYYIASDRRYDSWLWTKKYITLIQLVQFVLVLAQAIQLLYLIQYGTCAHPFAYAILQFVESAYFLYSFSSFYVHNYVKQHKKESISIPFNNNCKVKAG